MKDQFTLFLSKNNNKQAISVEKPKSELLTQFQKGVKCKYQKISQFCKKLIEILMFSLFHIENYLFQMIT